MPTDAEDEKGHWIWPDAEPVPFAHLGHATYDGPNTGDLVRGTRCPMDRLYHTIMDSKPPAETLVFRLAPEDAERLLTAAAALGLAPTARTT